MISKENQIDDEERQVVQINLQPNHVVQAESEQNEPTQQKSGSPCLCQHGKSVNESLVQITSVLKQFTLKFQNIEKFLIGTDQKLLQISNKTSQMSHQIQEIIKWKHQFYDKNWRVLTGLQYKSSTNFEVSIIDKTITFINSQWQDYHYFINQPISLNSNSFRLKIVKSKIGSIMIGVADYEQQKNQWDSHDSQNAVSYKGYDGTVYPIKKTSGKGFKQGDYVQVYVIQQTGNIKWYVNGRFEAQISHQKFRDSSITLYPYIEMCDRDDCVRWVT